MAIQLDPEKMVNLAISQAQVKFGVNEKGELESLSFNVSPDHIADNRVGQVLNKFMWRNPAGRSVVEVLHEERDTGRITIFHDQLRGFLNNPRGFFYNMDIGSITGLVFNIDPDKIEALLKDPKIQHPELEQLREAAGIALVSPSKASGESWASAVGGQGDGKSESWTTSL